MIFCFRTSFPVLEHPFPVLECLFPVFFFFVSWEENDFIPGPPVTEEFVPDFLLLFLSRDKGTVEKGNILLPAHRDNETSRPLELLIVMYQIHVSTYPYIPELDVFQP